MTGLLQKPIALSGSDSFDKMKCSRRLTILAVTNSFEPHPDVTTPRFTR